MNEINYKLTKQTKSNMKKRFTFLIAALGLLMTFLATPQGVWGETTYSLTPDQESTGCSSTSYITSLTEFTYNGVTWKMNQWNPSTLQVKTNQSSAASEFRFYNTSAFSGRITQVVITFESLTVKNENGFMFVGGTSEVSSTSGGTAGTWNSTNKTITWTPGASDNFTYFAFYQNGKVASGNNFLNDKNAIVVTYETGGSSTYTVTYNANGGTGDDYIDDNNGNGYESGALVTVLANEGDDCPDFTKPGHDFYLWCDNQDPNASGAHLYDPTDGESNTFNITSNTTLYAIWTVHSYGYTLNVTGEDGEAMASLYDGEIELDENETIDYGKEIRVEVAVSEGYTYTIGVKDSENNDVTVNNENTFTMPASTVTVTVTTVAITSHTITFNAGTGTCTISSLQGNLNSSIDLPLSSTVTAPEGWTFAGWCATNVSEATTTQPSLLTGSYTITGNATLYAVYRKTEVDNHEQIFNFGEIAEANGWQNGTAHTSVPLGDVTLTASGGGNNGKYYTSDDTWRMYSGGTVGVSTTFGSITSVTSTPSTTFTINNNQASYACTAQKNYSNITVAYGSSTTTYHTSPISKVETPTIEVTAGVSTGASNTYYETATITLACATGESTIHYTTDGTDPTSLSPTYSAPFAVTSTSTIKAIAVKDDYTDSDIASQAITIVQPNVATFTSGVYSSLNSSADFDTWYTYSVTGTQEWSWASYQGTYFARMSGYSGGANANVDWLISPKMTVNMPLFISLDFAANYGQEGVVSSLYYSTDYPGYGNPTSSTWTKLQDLPIGNNMQFEVLSMNMPASEHIFFAVKYISTGEYASTIEVKNFSAKQCYAVTYDANGGTGTMTDNDSPYAVGATVTTLANTFTAPDGMAFEAWNTQAEGEGTVYAAGAQFTMGTAPVTLYAQWIEPCTVKATMATTSTNNEYVNDAGDKSWTINLSSSVSALGGCDITEYGFVYSTSESTPTTETENTTKVAIGAEYTVFDVEFNHAITGVAENTTYYVRSYATNAAGTAYSAVVTATTEAYPTYTINYTTNGIEEEQTTVVYQGDNISNMLTSPEQTVPSGFTFMGWREGEYTVSDIDPNDYVNNGDAIVGNLNLKAVFAIAEGSLSNGSITETEITTNITNTACAYGTPKTYNDTEDGITWKASCYADAGRKWMQIKKDDASAYIKIETAGSISRVDVTITAASNDAGGINDITKHDPFTNTVFLATQASNDGTGSVGSTNEVNNYVASISPIGNNSTLYIQVTDGAARIWGINVVYNNSTYSKYCTSVELLSGNVSGIKTGACTVTAATTIKTGTELDVSNGFLVNSIAYNLIVEDGGQLVLNSTNTDVYATFEKNIESSISQKDTENNHWYTIATPVSFIENGIPVDNVINLADDDSGELQYNLYRYNEYDGTIGGGLWEAYNPGTHDDFTILEKGRGYLYRNNGMKLEFAGEVNVGNVTGITLNYTEASGNLKGFNLIGNPFGHSIAKGSGLAIDNANLSEGCYVLTNSGTWTAITDGNEIKPNQGVLVQTSATVNNFQINDVNYVAPAKYNNDNIQFAVSNNDYEDVTYAWFDKGYGLTKINHRNAEAPMLYIPQDGENFAIAMMSDDTKVFGLNFKATKMGQYTLSYKADGNYNYLHVIDRLTGEDVDMLMDGKYTFIASPSDNDERFIVKLEYMPDYGEGDSEIFAYQTGSEVLVSGEGELQIFDVTGRMVINRTIMGAEAISVPSQGVYIFRLVGTEVKTQKIVVR